MSTPILTTKLYLPPPPSNLIPRPRLIKKLIQGLNRKLTIISAPAGFGKTTLLSECVAHCDYPVAWFSMDEGDDDLVRFLMYMVSALQTINPDIKIEAPDLTNLTQVRSFEPILTELLNQVARLTVHFVLVLDDYHVIESLEIDQAVSFIVTNAPPHMHLIIATRTDPTFPLSRLRSRGQLTELRVDDLRFNPDEVARFLNKGMGVKISNQDLATLQSRTEGWIVGLQLAALSMQRLEKQKEITQFIDKFSSSNRFILDYLTDEVLEQRPSGTRDFLLQTSILDRLKGPLCSAVTDMENSQEILEVLEAANLFIVPLDNERCWYRYHHLFGDLLRLRLKRASPNLVPELHRRASTWYAQNELIPEAITHSLAAKDFQNAAQLTEQTFLDRMSRGENLTMMFARLAALPEEIIRAHPRLGVMHAWMSSLTLQLDAVEPRLVDVENQFGHQLPTDLHRQIAVVRAEVYRHQGEFQSAIEGSLKVLESLPEDLSFTDQQSYTGIVSNLAWGYALSGEMDQAQKWFKESLNVGQHSITLTLIGLYGLALVQELQGHLKQAIKTCLSGLKLIEETAQQIDNDVPATIYMHLRFGSLLRERNQLKEAEEQLLLGLASGKKWQVVGDTMRDLHLEFAKLKMAKGDFPSALDVLAQAEKLLNYYDSVRGFGDAITTQKARVHLASAVTDQKNNGLQAVADWVKMQNFSVNGLPNSINEEYAYLVWVRYLIAKGKPIIAKQVLEGLTASAEQSGRLGRVIEMHMLHSLAQQALGNFEGALSVLESALALAEADGYIRLFIDEGIPMEKLLRQAAAQNIASSYINLLLDAFKSPTIENQPASFISGQQYFLVEALSERELEVLHLLINGATNKEIAGELYIALTTAKKHVSNIIGKLGVSNRTQAVARARELNLI